MSWRNSEVIYGSKNMDSRRNLGDCGTWQTQRRAQPRTHSAPQFGSGTWPLPRIRDRLKIYFDSGDCPEGNKATESGSREIGDRLEAQCRCSKPNLWSNVFYCCHLFEAFSDSTSTASRYATIFQATASVARLAFPFCF